MLKKRSECFDKLSMRGFLSGISEISPLVLPVEGQQTSFSASCSTFKSSNALG
jgi:hypothetical protein